MTPNLIRSLPKIALTALFAVTTAGSAIVMQAANPAEPTSATLFAETSLPASAQSIVIRDRYPNGFIDVNFRGGYWHGRRWAHRRWQGGFYGPYHHWHPGHWVYF